jgi:hypothetical protein
VRCTSLWPAAQLAPHGHGDSCESGQPTKQPVKESDADVGRNSELHRLERWPRQAVGAVRHQQNTNSGAKIRRIDIGEQHRSDRHADRAADNEWRHIPPAQRVPQLPDAVALRPEAVADDQCCGLDWGDDVQPYADSGGAVSQGKAPVVRRESQTCVGVSANPIVT